MFRITTYDVAIIGVMTATLFGVKTLMDPLPNIELITLLLISYTLTFGAKTIYAAIVFSLLQCFIWGIGTWTIMYLYVWPLLVIFTLILKKYTTSLWLYSVFAAIYGLLFGMFCALPYLAIGGVKMAFTWWIAGIPYDFIHCVSNFVLTCILFTPLTKALGKIKSSGYSKDMII